MVLSESHAKPPSNIWKRTLIYVLAFGFGSLMVASLLGFTAISVAEGLLPQPKDRTATGARKGGPSTGDPKLTGKTTPPRKPGSKATRPRGNDTAGADKNTEQEL
jgi:hypothetical protein